MVTWGLQREDLDFNIDLMRLLERLERVLNHEGAVPRIRCGSRKYGTVKLYTDYTATAPRMVPAMPIARATVEDPICAIRGEAAPFDVVEVEEDDDEVEDACVVAVPVPVVVIDFPSASCCGEANQEIEGG